MLSRLKLIFPILVTSMVSFLLIAYVGYGEALRTAPKFEREKLVAQGEVIQTTVESFLRAGLPLSDFIGFDELSQPMIASDPGLSGIAIQNRNGTDIFTATRDNAARAAIEDSIAKLENHDWATQPELISDTHFVVALPLRSKFETAGYILLESPQELMQSKIEQSFIAIAPYLGGLLGLVFAASLFATYKLRGKIWPQEMIFGITFLIAAGLVSTVVVQIYSDGVQLKTQALADSLSSRLQVIPDLGLNFEDTVGIEDTISDYQALNPDISGISVSVADKVAFDSVPGNVGQPLVLDPDSFTHTTALDTDMGGGAQVSVSIPKENVYRAVLDNVRNFAAVFIATIFLAVVFIQVSLVRVRKGPPPPEVLARRKAEAEKAGANAGKQPDRRSSSRGPIDLIKPVYFMAVFIETLNASFLPQHLQSILASAALPENLSALLFSTFFITFALTLIPAGRMADARGPKPLLIVGAILSGLAQVMLALSTDLTAAILARALSGVGQGLFLIGVQCYILIHAQASKSTQGAGIIVYGFNGGMISGAAIGSLLSVYLGISGVFMVAAAIAAVLVFYIKLVIVNQLATTPEATPAPSGTADVAGQKNLLHLFKDFEFIRTMVLVGIPAKAVLAGVTIFALPLILSQLGFENDSIGQIIMFYAAGVLLMSHFATRWVDKLGKTVNVLVLGCFLSAAGLASIGAIGLDLEAMGVLLPGQEVILVIAGMFVLGCAHGMINAPVVTHVVKTPAVAQVGKGTSVATYRFLERIGHVAGPIVLANLLVWMDGDPLSLLYVGGVIAFFGILFFVPIGRSAKPESA